MSDSRNLRLTLRKFGLTDAAVNAAWPTWWSDSAESSPSANAELRFSLARKLGLEPKSLLNDEPKFVWQGKAKFKNLSGEDESIRAALASFGGAVGATLTHAIEPRGFVTDNSALALRNSILSNHPFIGLIELLAFCWVVGIPVIHLRVFPLSAKHMCAMVTRAENRFSILLAKDAQYPAPVAYYLAHELGHIFLGHLKESNSLVDLADPLEADHEKDSEEAAADKFALELLTGMSDLSVLTETKRYTAAQLAEVLLQSSERLRVEPGTLALCFGHSTKEWAKANAAMNRIYSNSHAVWDVVNRIAMQELDWSSVPEDSATFARAVMGGLR